MPNHSEQHLDEAIIGALKYDAVVSAAQKERAWDRLRDKVEARINAKNALGDTELSEGLIAFEATALEPEPMPSLVAFESDTFNPNDLTDAILETTPCCGGEIAEPQRENIFYAFMRRLSVGIGEGLESSARFLFWDDLALTARPGCVPLHRRHIMMVGSFMLANA
jgi:hypothetical protein